MSAQNKLFTVEYIKKQLSAKKTYKELQPMLKEVANQNQLVVQATLQSIRKILTEENATPVERLLAARLAKDCFERGSLAFIQGFVKSLLSVYVQLVEKLEPRCTEKDIKELTASVQLHSNPEVNLYVMLIESLRNWANWTKTLPNMRPLSEAHTFLQQKKFKGLTTQKFFSEWSAKWFEERLRKLPPTVFESTFKGMKKPQQEDQAPPLPAPPKPNLSKFASAPTEAIMKKEIQQILSSLEQLVGRSRQELVPILNSASEQLDKSVDKYCTNSANFDENYVNNCFSRFEAQKRKLLSQSQPPKEVPIAKPQPVLQKNMLQQLPERVDFHNNESQDQESSQMHESNKFTKSNKPRNLGIIVEEADEGPQQSANQKHIQKLQKQKQQIAEENAALQRKLNQLKNHPTLEVQNSLMKELMDVKRKKFLLSQEVETMQRRAESLQSMMVERQKQPLKQIKVVKEAIVKPGTPVAEFGGSGVAPSELNAINNSSHILARMLRCFMSVDNIMRFKLVALGASRELYKEGPIIVTIDSRLENKLGSDLRNVNLEVAVPQYAELAVKYKNPPAETDLWTKPLIRSNAESPYHQQLTIKMLKPPELITIGKVTSSTIPAFQFALPVLFISFLRNGQVVESAFRTAFDIDRTSIIRSSQLAKNNQILRQPSDLNKYFENAFLTREGPTTISNSAFLLPSHNKIFLTKMLFKDNNISIEVLELESQGRRRASQQLLSDLIFLFTI